MALTVLRLWSLCWGPSAVLWEHTAGRLSGAVRPAFRFLCLTFTVSSQSQYFFFKIFLFILWEFHTCLQCMEYMVIMPTPHFFLQLLPDPHRGPPSTFMLSFSIFHHIRLFRLRARGCGSKHWSKGNLPVVRTPEKMTLPPQPPPPAPQLGARPGEPLSSHAGVWTGLILQQEYLSHPFDRWGNRVTPTLRARARSGPGSV